MKHLLMIIFVGMIFTYLNAFANGNDERNSHDHHGHDYDQVDTNVTEVTELTEVTNVTNVNNYLNTDTMNDHAAIFGAFGAMPSITGKTGLLIGTGAIHNSAAIGLGLEHQEGNKAFKGVIGVSGSETVVGAGASFSW